VFNTNRLATYSDFISVSVPFDSGINGTIPASSFVDLVKKLDADIKVSLEFKKNTIKISGVATEFEAGFHIVADDAKILGCLNEVNKNRKSLKPKKLPEDFWEGIRLILFTASQNKAKEALTGVFVDNMNMFSSDDFRIGLYRMKKDSELSCLISASSLEAILPFSDKLTHCCWSKENKWIHFTDDKDEVTFSLSLFLFNYPDIPSLFPKETGLEFSSFSNGAGLMSALARSNSLATGEAGYQLFVKLNVRKDGIDVQAQKEDESWYREFIKMGIKGLVPGITILINPDFLLKILPYTLEFSYLKEENRILFRSGTYRQLIGLPVSVKEGE
jgi:DNA polymerase III sliding clamp (beta) subunit (PCNA family)